MCVAISLAIYALSIMIHLTDQVLAIDEAEDSRELVVMAGLQ